MKGIWTRELAFQKMPDDPVEEYAVANFVIFFLVIERFYYMFNQSANNLESNSQMSFVTRRGFDGSKPSMMYHDGTKRVLDIVFILLALPFLVPLLLFTALIVGRDGHGVFYSQERVGRNGRAFRIWKFRTMVPDAKQRLDDLIARDADIAQEWHSTQKLKNDPRIIPAGHLLRKTSIDELPQLWNVLKGEMSLVGPRPMMTDQKDMYPGTAYFEMRPGLTGLWQISDRNKSTFAARATYDTTYYRQMSLLTDFKILVATVGVVIRGTGC